VRRAIAVVLASSVLLGTLAGGVVSGGAIQPHGVDTAPVAPAAIPAAYSSTAPTVADAEQQTTDSINARRRHASGESGLFAESAGGRRYGLNELGAVGRCGARRRVWFRSARWWLSSEVRTLICISQTKLRNRLAAAALAALRHGRAHHGRHGTVRYGSLRHGRNARGFLHVGRRGDRRGCGGAVPAVLGRLQHQARRGVVGKTYRRVRRKAA